MLTNTLIVINQLIKVGDGEYIIGEIIFDNTDPSLINWSGAHQKIFFSWPLIWWVYWSTGSQIHWEGDF